MNKPTDILAIKIRSMIIKILSFRIVGFIVRSRVNLNKKTTSRVIVT
jgi:hypothetical protein